MAKTETFSFNISERGDMSGETFNWSFTAKKFLSMRDRINKDSIRRGLLGDSPQNASPDTQIRVEMLSHLQVSLVETPKAWRDSNNGLDLLDDNILISMYEETNRQQNQAIEDNLKAGEEAKTKLREKAKKKDKEEEPA